MPAAIKRVLAYAIVAAICYTVAVFFVESRATFIVVFFTGFVIGMIADVLLLTHLIRLPFTRHRR